MPVPVLTTAPYHQDGRQRVQDDRISIRNDIEPQTRRRTPVQAQTISTGLGFQVEELTGIDHGAGSVPYPLPIH
jgi:hypothetical protein